MFRYFRIIRKKLILFAMKPGLIFFSLLFLISACGDHSNQSSFLERGDAGSAVTDSLLFMQYSERLGYHYSIRSDSVSWYIDEMIDLAKRNNKQLEVLQFTALKASEFMNAGDYAPAWEYYIQAFEMAQNPGIENHYWRLGNHATPEKSRLWHLSNLHFNYGHLMYLTENSEERLNQYRLANRIAVQNDDVMNVAYTSDGLAMAYLEKRTGLRPDFHQPVTRTF